MGPADYVPGFKSGARGRNALLIIFILVTIPVWLVVLPFVSCLMIWRNWYGWGDLFGRIPGLDPGGSLKSGFIVGIALLIIAGGVFAIIPGAAPDASQDTTALGGGTGSQPTGTTPASTSTSTPTATATSTPTPTATLSPTPTPSPTPEPTPAPDGQSFSFSGSGQSATDTFKLEQGLVTIDLSHEGDRNFIVTLINSETGNEELLVNTIGGFDGTVGLYTPSDEYVLDIEADGQWSADVEQPRYSQVEVGSLPVDVSRSDYAVLGPYQFEGTTRFTIEAETDRNVIAYLANHQGQNVELLVNEIGPHEGSTVITQTGVGLIIVETEGDWTIRLEEN